MNEAAPAPIPVAGHQFDPDACVRRRAELHVLTSYIPNLIVRQQLDRPQLGYVGGVFLDGTVLFADLSGFTMLSERLSALGKQGAEEVSAVINRLFGALLAEIERYGGEVLKFGGDALTAFFDRAALNEHHAALAAGAALALQQRMHEFDALATPAGVFRLRLRIGVHSGRVFAAQVGDAEHIELVVTGRTINRVALAQEIAESGEVVVSESTLRLVHGATTNPRQSGFHLLEQLLSIPPAHSVAAVWTPGAGDHDELAALEARIAALRPYLPRHLPGRFLEQAEGVRGEFRSVSVLFANFFPFSAALDLLGDDTTTAAQVLNAYYLRSQQVIHRYGGIVNKVDMSTYGDKLMALFGAPTAHENSPELAVRAALELQAVLAHANQEIAALLQAASPRDIAGGDRVFHQRIGINTGVMFAGLVGSAQRREYTVMGQHVNLSARLMAAADDGMVLVSPATRRMVERHIALRSLEPVRLKGIAEPVPLAEALRPLDVALDAPRALLRPSLTGRDREIALLLDVGGQALRGHGQVVALVGEAGVGKSRLFEETLQRLVGLSIAPGSGVPPFFPYSVECQSYEQSTPYALARQLLRQLLNLDFLESTGDAGSVQRRVAELAPELARFTPLLADLTGAPLADTPLTAVLAPEQRRDRAQELAEALILNSARQQPLLMILDDLHWADASSLDLLARLVRHTEAVPLLLLLGYRADPPIAEPWAGLPHGRRVALGELSAEHGAALLGALLGAAPPPELAVLLEKTQGNPFYIEEVVRGLVESGTLLRDGDGWRLARPLDDDTVPDSIEGVIVARLDRLEERSREVLQVASVVGRRFPYQVLLGLLLRTDDLQERLGSLTSADIILIEEIERELAYLFKHALTRDVAYEAILYARRRELHRSVARQIEQLYPERLDEQLGLLARHYLLAEEWSQAFEYHLRAGRQAQARYANREAISFFERALKIAQNQEWNTNREAVPPGSSRFLVLDAHRIESHERLGVVHALIGEYDAALAHYEAALALLDANASAATDERVRLRHHIARVYEKRAEFETAFQWVDAALALDPAIQQAETVRVLLLGAGLHRRQGRYAQALEWGERALSQAEQVQSVRDQAEALMLLGGTHIGTGDNVRAFELTTRCLNLFQEIQDLPRVADAHNNLANICYELGRLDEARTHYEAGFEIKQAIGDVYGQAMIANNLGNSLKLLGDIPEAITQYQQSLKSFEQLGSLYASGVLHMNLGATYVLSQNSDIAEVHLHRSAELFQQAGAEDFLPELERYLTELQLLRGDLPRARLACELALDTAARMEARAEEGITRRLLAHIYTLDGEPELGWQELQASLLLLREANNRYEIACTLLAQAQLAPQIGKAESGQQAFTESIALLQLIGARRDLRAAESVAAACGYTLM